MPSKKRKLEFHKLTISGLKSGTRYSDVLKAIMRATPGLSARSYDVGAKTHALHSVQLSSGTARIAFISYAAGYRPDILDTTSYDIQPNPLSDDQTAVDWTHVLGVQQTGRFLLIIEKHQQGIWPKSLEVYLQQTLDDIQGHEEIRVFRPDRNPEPIDVSIEAEADANLIQKIDRLERVTKATVRTNRPNPGFQDLESELAGEADASDARRAEVTMFARARGSLSRSTGIVGAIKSMVRRRTLDYAAIEGERDGNKVRFSSENLVRQRFITLNLDNHGQVQHDDAWRKLSRVADAQAADDSDESNLRGGTTQ